MKKYLILFYLLLFISFRQAYAQTDVLELKKKGSNEKTYAPGMPIAIETIYQQWFDGTITDIRHDSIFVNGLPFHYKEIRTIRRERKKLNYATGGTLLMIAGGGVMLLGAVNGLYRKDPVREWYTTGSFITAGAFLAGGFFLRRARYKTYKLGRKYTLRYVELNLNKNQSHPF